MNSIAEDIKDILVAEAGFVFKTNLFISKLPTKINNCTVIYDTSSAPIDTTLDGENIHNDSVEVLVRNESYLTAHQIAATIVSVLHAKANELWNDTYYLYIGLMSGPAEIPYSGRVDTNKKGLKYLSINFNIKRSSEITNNNNSNNS